MEESAYIGSPAAHAWGARKNPGFLQISDRRGVPAGRAAARQSPGSLKLRAPQTDQRRQEGFYPVAVNFVRSLCGFDSRRAFRVLQFGTQIRLPLYLLLITAAFMSLFAWNAHSGYVTLYTMVMTNVPESF